jgi:UDP-glucose 6-dehydrogenase
MDQATPRYSGIGLGKLGSSLAAFLAAKGLFVTGVDADLQKVDSINQGRAPIFEARLEDTIQAGARQPQATASIAGAVAASDAIMDARAHCRNSLTSAGYAIWV